MKKLAAIGILIIGGLGIWAVIPSEEPLGAPTLPDQAHTIAGERIEFRQRGNVAEVKAPWKGQPGITIKHDFGNPGQRKKQPQFETTEDGFKFDYLLTEKPDSNIFCQTIEGHENYNFFYQPALTQEEIDEGAERPDNVVGSYAVYHKTLKNHRVGGVNYETGKAMHIYRPQVWEVDDKTNTIEWADLSYDNGNLCVTVNQSYLDNATYPVRVDPTFGYTSQGGTNSVLCNLSGPLILTNRKGIVASTTENGTIDSMSGYFLTDEAGGITTTLFFAVNEKDSGGVGSHGLTASAQASTTFSSSFTLETINFGSESITSGTDYIVNASCDPNHLLDDADDIDTAFDSVSGAPYYSEQFTTASGFSSMQEDPWTDSESAGFKYSIYATYTADSGETTVTQTTTLTGDMSISGDIIVE